MKTNPFKKLAVSALVAIALCAGSTVASAGTIVDTDRLYEGQSMTYTIYLSAGECARFAVVADDDAFDVDLVAKDVYGNTVDYDVCDDSNPIVELVAPRSGTYRITVDMVDTYLGTWAAYNLIRY